MTGIALTARATPTNNAKERRPVDVGRDEPGRQEEPGADPQTHGDDQAAEAHGNGRGDLAAQEPGVDLDAGEPDQQDQAHLADRVDQVGLAGEAREQPPGQARGDRAEQRRPERDPREQLAHHRGHAEPGGEGAEQARDEHQQAELEGAFRLP